MSNRLRIGVCGVGSIGLRHARLLSRRPDVDLFLCDVSFAQVDSVPTFTNLCGYTDRLETLLDWGLHGLVISTPDGFHVSQTIAACESGAFVLLEKPIAEDSQQAIELLRLENSDQQRILVGYVLRYATCMCVAKTLLTEGIIGNPISFQVMLGAYDTLLMARSRFSDSRRNTIFSDYSHEWDYIDWLLGKVRAVVGISHQSGSLEISTIPNVVDAIVELENGVTGTVHLDYVQQPSHRRIKLIGDRGTIDINVDQGLITSRTLSEQFSRAYQTIDHRDDAFERQLDHFISMIRKAEPPLVTVKDGYRALQVADAMIHSCASRSWQNVGQDSFEMVKIST